MELRSSCALAMVVFGGPLGLPLLAPTLALRPFHTWGARGRAAFVQAGHIGHAHGALSYKRNTCGHLLKWPASSRNQGEKSRIHFLTSHLHKDDGSLSLKIWKSPLPTFSAYHFPQKLREDSSFLKLKPSPLYISNQ